MMYLWDGKEIISLKGTGTIERVISTLFLKKFYYIYVNKDFSYYYPLMEVFKIGNVGKCYLFDINNFFISAFIELLENGVYISNNGQVIYDREANYFIDFEDD